jgi:trk system potassium uptake protein TrkH
VASRADPRLPGNRVLRRRRLYPEIMQVRPQRHISITPRPWMIAAAFAVVIGLGALLLALPASSESRAWTSGWDSLFTAVSAVCVTGLTRFDSATHWSGFGEAVIAGLIQLEGLGVTMYAGLLVLVIGGRFGLRGREFFGMELMDVTERDVRRLLRRLVIFVVVVESVTFLLLLPWFLDNTGGPRGAWQALFHTISAFNNAGFDLMGGGTGFQGQVSSPYPVVVMGISAFLGTLSFITVFQMRRRPRFWSLDTRFVVLGMFGFLALGMILLLAAEVQPGQPLSGLGPVDALANTFFLSVNRTVEMAAMREVTTVVLLVLMFIGGSSTSTSGRIKMGAFMVTMSLVVAALRGRHRPEAFGREIPMAIVIRAVSVIVLMFIALTVGVIALAITDPFPFLALDFEVMSALANVGWSHRLVTRADGRALHGRCNDPGRAHVPRSARADDGGAHHPRSADSAFQLPVRSGADWLGQMGGSVPSPLRCASPPSCSAAPPREARATRSCPEGRRAHRRGGRPLRHGGADRGKPWAKTSSVDSTPRSW